MSGLALYLDQVTVSAPFERFSPGLASEGHYLLYWLVLTSFPCAEPYPTTYIVPRPGTTGEVILGGTFIKHDYTTHPDPAIAKRILESAIKIEPLLAPKTAGRQGSWEDIEILSHNAGLRPCRNGGPRIELEHRVLGQAGLGPRVAGGLSGKKVGVVHVYGFGPAG